MRATLMVAQRPSGPTFPAASDLARAAGEELVQTHGEDELAQWSTAEIWSTAYALLHSASLDVGFRRAPAVRPVSPLTAVPERDAGGDEPEAEEHGSAAQGHARHAPAVAIVRTPLAGTPILADGPEAGTREGHWRATHVRICLEALPLNERRFLQVLLESDSAPMAQRAAHWPVGDETALLTATRQLLSRVRASIEGREAAMRDEGLT